MTFAPCRQNRKRARPSLLQAVMARNYAGPNGTIFVAAGLGGDSYMTFWRKDSGALCRVKSKILPTRKTFAQAQQDLDAYAKCHRFSLVGGSDRTPEARAALAEHLVALEKKRKKELKMPKTKSPAKKRAAPTAPKRPKKEPVEPANIGVDDIVPSPFQPRGPESFPEAEIEALAQSIAGQGQLQPVVLRRIANVDARARYELVDGERRWRAVQRLKWHTIRAEVQRHSDAEARAAPIASAIHHKDLNAIEEARAMKAAIDAGDAKGPTQLAEMLGVSQGHVSNRLRLLTVPDDWQARVISGEITERHARAVVPHIDNAGLLADASDLLAARRMTAEEFEAAVAMLAKGTLGKKGARGEGRGAREEDAPQKRAGRFAPGAQFAGDPSKFAEGLLAGRRDPMKVPPPAAAAPDEEPDDLAAAWDAGKWDRELAKLDKYIRGIAERWPEVPEIRNALAQRLRHMARELTLS